MIEEAVLKCLSETIAQTLTKEDFDVKPIEELEMDSVSIMDFVIHIEECFEIDFSDFSSMSQHMDTVGDMVEYFVQIIQDVKG